MEIYQEEYEKLINKRKAGVQIGKEEVGEMIAVLAQYFGDKNLIMAEKENSYRKKAVVIVNGTDPNNTAKPISAAKAEVLTNATIEAEEYRIAKVHKENVEQYINALKSWQRALTTEIGVLGGV